MEQTARQNGLEQGREALRRFLVGDDDLSTMLGRVTLIATEAIPGCDLASITLMKNGQPTTPVFTDKAALVLDEAQYEAGDGPCLSAIRHRGVEHVTTASEQRWPDFVTAARRHDVTACLSLPMVDETGPLGGLNLYSTTTSAYTDDARAAASLFADQLGIAAANAVAYASAFELAAQLRAALESRAVIEQAKGILMAAQRCGPDQAFDILRRASQNQNRKLRDIAFDMVDRYASEDTPA